MDFARRLAQLALACSLIAAADASHAVNLVLNPSFESFTSCPFTFGQTSFATSWNAPTLGTSDYFNACAPATFPSVNVPYTQLGYRTARTGDGMAGLIPYSAAPDYREYVQAPLASPLIAGQTYQVQFYIAVAETASIAVDRIGAYLSVGAVGPVPNDAPLPFTPQVESPAATFLTDAVNWTAVSGTFVAAGGEDHIVIGSFRDDASTLTTAGPGPWPGGAYYVVDDVSVALLAEEDQACCMADGLCTILLPAECQAFGGAPLGPGSSCSPDPCGPTPVPLRSWGTLKVRYR
jgi:hypothetical protein